MTLKLQGYGQQETGFLVAFIIRGYDNVVETYRQDVFGTQESTSNNEYWYIDLHVSQMLPIGVCLKGCRHVSITGRTPRKLSAGRMRYSIKDLPKCNISIWLHKLMIMSSGKT